MEVSVEHLLQIIGEEHVKVALLEQQVVQLKRLLAEQTKTEEEA